MNRPYHAFAALLGLLVVAMMAVGLSSRPSSSPTSRVAGTPAAATRAPGAGGVAYLIALPNEKAEPADDRWADYGSCSGPAACDQPTYAAGCGLDRATGRVYPVFADLPHAGLQSARVSLADRPPVEATAGAMDCRSHYDLAYDAAVYGAAQASPPRLRREIEPADPMLLLFDSLLSSQPQEPTPAPLRNDSASNRWQAQLRTVVAAINHRLWWAAQRVGLGDDWLWARSWMSPQAANSTPADAGPGWADYEAWIASLQPHVAPWNSPSGGSEAIPPSGSGLLQFAVAGLNHASKTLAELADRLEQLDSNHSSAHLGVRGAALRPR